MLTTNDVAREIARADHIANSDNWPGSRAERTADVQTQYLRAIAVGLGALAAATDALAEQTRSVATATYTAAGP